MPKIVIFDTAYGAEYAVTAGVLISAWEAALPEETCCQYGKVQSPYVPGEFFKRELPGILHFLEQVTWHPDLIVIDGYVSLGQGRKGMGMHLYEALYRAVPIVGVAKNAFRNNDTALPILRGKAKKPLYITAMGIDLHDAAVNVQKMHGEGRLPYMLKLVDHLSKTAPPGPKGSQPSAVKVTLQAPADSKGR